MNERTPDSLVEQDVGKLAYEKPVLRRFGTLHMTTRGPSAGPAVDGGSGMIGNPGMDMV